MGRLPEYTSFLNVDNMGEFWKIVKWLLFYIAPIAMIMFAIKVVSYFIYTIRKSSTKEDNEYEYEPYQNEDDYEVYHYRD